MNHTQKCQEFTVLGSIKKQLPFMAKITHIIISIQEAL
jgi:hypothetical protein